MSSLIERVAAGFVPSAGEGALLYRESLHALGRAAHELRLRLLPSDRVTFVVDRNISYTNACEARCDFCLFSRDLGDEQVFVLSPDEVLSKVRELVRAGGTQVLLQGGLNPELRLDFFLDLLRRIKREFPDVTLHSFSPTEVDFLSRLEGLGALDVLVRLKEAGLDSMPGGGGEILVERVRQAISPKKISAERWLEIERLAHQAGLMTTATMVIGHVEKYEERIEHLLRLRALQEETKGIRAFIPWTMQTNGTRLDVRGVMGEDYLKTVAISRLLLQNIPHIQSGWVTEGHALAQIALFFGADDMGGIVMEESVISPTGIRFETNIAQMVRLIHGAHFRAVQRNTRYEELREFAER